MYVHPPKKKKNENNKQFESIIIGFNIFKGNKISWKSTQNSLQIKFYMGLLDPADVFSNVHVSVLICSTLYKKFIDATAVVTMWSCIEIPLQN